MLKETTIVWLLIVIVFVIKLLYIIAKEPVLIPIIGSLIFIFIAVYYGYTITSTNRKKR